MKKLFLSTLLVLALAGCSHFKQTQGTVLNLFVKAPHATSVYLATSLDNFTLHPARKTHSGMWIISVNADTQFSYFYVIDGKPCIPECTYKERDGFGGENCVFIPDM